MRFLLVMLFALLTLPAFAQEGQRYDNGRFGYSISVPPGFVGNGESDNGDGDGQSFYDARGGKGLVVWGGNLTGPFEAEFADVMDYAVAENGWNITYQAVTPRWASFSGVDGSRVVYQRMILLCDGASYAAFRAEYSTLDLTEMDAVIERMVQSLTGKDCR